MKKLFCVLLAIVMLLSLAACGAPAKDAAADDKAPATAEATKAPVDSKKTVVTVLCPGDEVKTRAFLEPLVEQFEAENPDLDVEPMYKGWTDWIATYPSMFQSGTQPDVIMWWGHSLNEEYVKGKFVPIGDYVDPAVVAEIPQNMIDEVTFDGVQYLLPVDSSGFLLYFRRDIFEQAGLDPNAPPTTWEELLYCCEQIAANTDVYPLAMPQKSGTEALHELVAMLISQSTGDPLLNENNEIMFNTEAGLKALEFLVELQKYTDPKSIEYARGDTRQLFLEGKVAMTMGDGIWAVPGLQAAFGENLDETVAGIACPPAGPAGKYNKIGVNGWVIAQKDNADAAGRLVSFLYSPESIYAYHKIYGSTPYLQYEFEQEEFSYDFYKVAMEATFEYTGYQGMGKYHPIAAGIYKPVEPIWAEMVMGDITPKEALANVVEELEAINARYGIGG